MTDEGESVLRGAREALDYARTDIVDRAQLVALKLKAGHPVPDTMNTLWDCIREIERLRNDNRILTKQVMEAAIRGTDKKIDLKEFEGS